MSGIADWADLMTSVVTVQAFISRDDYGQPVFGSPHSYSARVEYRQRLIRTAQAEQVVARGRAWLATVDPISTQDHILLPDGSTPLILDVAVVTDENGPLYTSLYFS